MSSISHRSSRGNLSSDHLAKATSNEVSTQNRRTDLVIVLLFVALPVLIFTIPALLGRVVLPGDDLSQNFPLRALVGADLRHGHLPLLDPYIWSGAPLLGGWNAGAGYPFTWIFAFIPATAAWVINQIIAGATAGVGMYLFMRAQPLRPMPSALGTVTFAFGGAMAAQTSHFGLLAGMSWVPWMLLSILKISRAPHRSFCLKWVAAFALSGALCVLAGEPRAVDDAFVIVVIYALWVLWRVSATGASRARTSFFILLGAALAISLSAIQWAPGFAAISSSQRATHSFSLFTSGSLPVRWLILMLVPNFLGGSGTFHSPSFLPTYNLTEITGYVGILPLVAFVALPVAWLKDFVSQKRVLFQIGKSRIPEKSQLRNLPLDSTADRADPIWHVVAIIGVLLALGGNTVLGTALYRLPLFGNQRLQSRNILIADFALAMILALWLERVTQSRARAEKKHRRWSELVPAALVGLCVVAFLVQSRRVLSWFGVSVHRLDQAGPLSLWLLPSLVLSIGAVLVLVKLQTMDARRRSRILVIFVLLDIVSFLITTVIAIGVGSPGNSLVSVVTTQETQLPHHVANASIGGGPPNQAHTGQGTTKTVVPISSLHPKGRFAIYDPQLVGYPTLPTLGVPDSNALLSTYAIQGYGSIVDGTYAKKTGTHISTGNGQDVLTPASIRNGVLSSLDTSTLIAPIAYLTHPRSGAKTAAQQTTHPVDLGSGQTQAWNFGRDLHITSVDFICSALSKTSHANVTVSLLSARTTSGRHVNSSKNHTVDLDSCKGASHEIRAKLDGSGVGLEIRSKSGADSLSGISVEEETGQSIQVNGILQRDLQPLQWSFREDDGPFAIFSNEQNIGPVSLSPKTIHNTPNASIRPLTSSSLVPAQVLVTSQNGAEVLRAVASIPGWIATFQTLRPSNHGKELNLSITSDGVIQSVAVPPGKGIVRWTYIPPGWKLGSWLSSVSLALLVIYLLAAVLMRFARRRS